MGAPPVVVCDTNVLISAFGGDGPERQVYRRVRAGQLRLVTSSALLAELARVLAYPKFGLEQREVDEVLGEVRSVARLVRPTDVPALIPEDPDDDHVLACAVRGQASWIVTGDQLLLALGEYRGVQIVTAPVLLRDTGG